MVVVGGSSTVHEGFPFLFCFPKSQICTRKRSTLITCGQQAMMIYCESHESVVEIKPGEPVGDWSLSGIECVGELSLRVFTK